MNVNVNVSLRMLPNVAVVSGWCNKISVNVSVSLSTDKENPAIDYPGQTNTVMHSESTKRATLRVACRHRVAGGSLAG